jgi:hypothetical protein
MDKKEVLKVLQECKNAKDIHDVQKLLQKYSGTAYENVVHSFFKTELYIITLLTKNAGGRR